MLVLTRTPNERVLIDVRGTTVEVMVCGVRDDRVRLGFIADPAVTIHREEVAEAIRAGRPVSRKNHGA